VAKGSDHAVDPTVAPGLTSGDPAQALLRALDRLALVALGALPPDPTHCPPGTQALVLVGPKGGHSWWQEITTSPEWRDGRPDPIDRWSHRVLAALATRFVGGAIYPSDGPPYPPFQRWAHGTGRMWQSPVGLLVHADAGLWVSFRGALAVPFSVSLPASANPCGDCAARPCLAACPASALTSSGYDVPACRAFLNTPAGKDCMSHGCAVRRACPIGISHARLSRQSAYHMRQFHP